VQKGFFIYLAHSSIPKNHSVMNIKVSTRTNINNKIFICMRFIIIEVGSKILISTSNIKNIIVIKKKLVEKMGFFVDKELNPHSNGISFSLVVIFFSLMLKKIAIKVVVIAIKDSNRV